jgi:hypothetical protein
MNFIFKKIKILIRNWKYRDTKKRLDQEEKILCYIPIEDQKNYDPNFKQYETVSINGYKLTIQKGVVVKVPKTVASLLVEKYYLLIEKPKKRSQKIVKKLKK